MEGSLVSVEGGGQLSHRQGFYPALQSCGREFLLAFTMDKNLGDCVSRIRSGKTFKGFSHRRSDCKVKTSGYALSIGGLPHGENHGRRPGESSRYGAGQNRNHP